MFGINFHLQGNKFYNKKGIAIPSSAKFAVLEVLLVLLPGSLLLLFTNNPLWFICSFFSGCSIMAYGTFFTKKYSVIIFAALMCITSFALLMILEGNLSLCPLCGYDVTSHKVLFSIALVLLALLLGTLEYINPLLSTPIAWFFIGIIYTPFNFYEKGFAKYNPSYLMLIAILLVTMISVWMSLFFSPKIKKISTPKKIKFKYQLQEIIYHGKYAIPLIVALILWNVFSLQKTEWLIWSSLVVVNINARTSWKKVKDRSLAGILGVIAGLLISFLLPNNKFIMFFCYYGIFLTYRTLGHRIFLMVTITCTLLILISNQNFLEMGKLRFINIILGAIIGYSSSVFLHHYNKSKKRMDKKKLFNKIMSS